jgi:hypothetical protein
VSDVNAEVDWLLAPEVNHKRVEMKKKRQSRPRPPRVVAPLVEEAAQEGGTVVERILQSFAVCGEDAVVVSDRHANCVLSLGCAGEAARPLPLVWTHDGSPLCLESGAHTLVSLSLQRHPDKPTLEPVRCWEVLPDFEHMGIELVTVVRSLRFFREPGRACAGCRGRSSDFRLLTVWVNGEYNAHRPPRADHRRLTLPLRLGLEGRSVGRPRWLLLMPSVWLPGLWSGLLPTPRRRPEGCWRIITCPSPWRPAMAVNVT